MGWFIFSIVVFTVSYLIAKKAEDDRLNNLDFIELCKAIARDEGLGTISDDLASKVIYNETGWWLNCWSIPRDGDTPRECLVTQLKHYFSYKIKSKEYKLQALLGRLQNNGLDPEKIKTIEFCTYINDIRIVGEDFLLSGAYCYKKDNYEDRFWEERILSNM